MSGLPTLYLCENHHTFYGFEDHPRELVTHTVQCPYCMAITVEYLKDALKDNGIAPWYKDKDTT